MHNLQNQQRRSHPPRLLKHQGPLLHRVSSQSYSCYSQLVRLFSSLIPVLFIIRPQSPLGVMAMTLCYTCYSIISLFVRLTSRHLLLSFKRCDISTDRMCCLVGRPLSQRAPPPEPGSSAPERSEVTAAPDSSPPPTLLRVPRPRLSRPRVLVVCERFPRARLRCCLCVCGAPPCGQEVNSWCDRSQASSRQGRARLGLGEGLGEAELGRAVVEAGVEGCAGG